MKKRILSLLLAIFTMLHVMPWSILDFVAESEYGDSGMEIEDMIVGKVYSAEFITENQWFIPYTVDEEGYLVWKGFPDVSRTDAYVLMADFPQDLKVMRTSEEDITSVYVINEDWPAEYDGFRYLDWADVIIRDRYYDESDEELVYGEVKLTVNGEEVASVSIKKAEKVYVFTELSDVFDEEPSYSWQILVDDDKWANIQNYCAPYAPVSEALVLNGENDGSSMLRCIATLDGVKYVSDEIEIFVDRGELASFDMESYIPLDKLDEIYYNQGDSSDSEDSSDGDSEETPDEPSKGDPALIDDSNDPQVDVTQEAFQITVNYIYWNASPLAAAFHGQVARDTFTVTLLPGETYNSTKNHPVIPGYKAYVRVSVPDGETPPADARYYEAPNPEDSTETIGAYYVEAQPIIFQNEKIGREEIVYYLPVEVSFTVNHYLQDLDSDEYTLYKTDFRSGYSDHKVGGSLNLTESDYADIVGFSALYYDVDTRISSNGNTSVDIYYDRNYYLIDLDLTTPDGSKGYGVMPLYVRYGSSVLLGTPTAPGYTFNGWTLEKVYHRTESVVGGSIVVTKTPIEDQSILNMYTNASAMLTIKHNLSYEASWAYDTTTYTVIYWLENVDDNNFTLNSFKVFNATPGTVVNASDRPLDLDGNEENNFVFLEGMSDKNIVVKGDGTTSINCYYSRKYYPYSFVVDGESCIFGGSYSHTHGVDCDKDLLCTQYVHEHNEDCGESVKICSFDVDYDHPQHNSSCCVIDEHTKHTVDCYDNVGDRQNGNPTSINDPDPGTVYRTGWFLDYDYYIYIDNVWYEYNGRISSASSTVAVNNSCPGLHTHNDGQCVGNDALHSHNENCYDYPDCDEVSHKHTDGCYGQCKLYEHVCSRDDETGYNGTNLVYATMIKYEADTTYWWNLAPTGYRWVSGGSGYTAAPSMPSGGIQFEGEKLNNSYQYRIHYYEEGTTYSIRDDSVYYRNSNSYHLNEADYIIIPGFTCLQKDDLYPDDNLVYTLYYSRNHYNLIFHDGVNQITDATESILFEADISGKYFEPDLPFGKEEGSLDFAGWYTTNTCADGTNFVFDGQKMPARDLTLYAKWEPTYWNVTIYQDEDKDRVLSTITNVAFGTILSLSQEPTRKPPTTGYIFAGWYYMDGSTEKRFDFNTMPVKGHLEIYAKWTSEVPVPYTINYVTYEDGVKVNVSDPTTGVSLAGLSKSFLPKVNTDLYDAYEHGYFPDVAEKTFKMEAEGNVFEFVYTKQDKVPYRITHVFDSEDIDDLIPEGKRPLTLSWDYEVSYESPAQLTVSFKTLITKNEIVSKLKTGLGVSQSVAEEIWNKIILMSPDAYSQRLTLIATDKPKDNEIVFNWTSDFKTVVYEVRHYYESLNDVNGDGDIDYDDYELRSSQSYRVSFDSSNPADATFEKLIAKGFKFKEYVTNSVGNSLELFQPTVDSSGNLGDGLIINVYYSREIYKFTVKHYDQNNSPITGIADISAEGKYEQKITVGDYAQDIHAGYVLDNGSSVYVLEYNNQEIIARYIQQNVYYEYVVDGEGASLKMDFAEAVPFGTRPKGNKVVLSPGYTFEGWYYVDSEGNETLIDETQTHIAEIIDTYTIKPVIPDKEDVNKTFVFKAKISLPILTISNSIEGSISPTESTPYWVISDQGFIYVIKGADSATEDVSLRIAVIGSVSISGLPIGKYSITVEDDWSWRYNEPNEVNGNVQSNEFGFYGNTTLNFVYEAPLSDRKDVSGAPIVGSFYRTDEAHN